MVKNADPGAETEDLEPKKPEPGTAEETGARNRRNKRSS